MKNLLLTFGIVLLIFTGITGCSDDPVQSKNKKETFPITYTFTNTNDTTVYGGFELYMGRYYPEKDSSITTVTRVSGKEIGEQTEYVFSKRPGYSGVKMVLIFSAMKIWPDHWPEQEPLYQTQKWFYIEKRTLEDSADATMSFVWPKDTARTDVHEFDPDTTDGDFGFEGSAGERFNELFQKIGRQK